jgi:hypothetical protein
MRSCLSVIADRSTLKESWERLYSREDITQKHFSQVWLADLRTHGLGLGSSGETKQQHAAFSKTGVTSFEA